MDCWESGRSNKLGQHTAIRSEDELPKISEITVCSRSKSSIPRGWLCKNEPNLSWNEDRSLLETSLLIITS